MVGAAVSLLCSAVSGPRVGQLPRGECQGSGCEWPTWGAAGGLLAAALALSSWLQG